MMNGDEYIAHAIKYNVGIVLGTYQKMLMQWFGDDFLIKAPDNLLNYFEQIMRNAKDSKDALTAERDKQKAEQEAANADKDKCASGCDAPGPEAA